MDPTDRRMPAGPPPLPRAQRRGCSPFAIGCGTVVVLVVLLIAGLVVWLWLPGGERIEMETVIGTNAVAMVHLTDCTRDPGVLALLERLEAVVRDAQRLNLQRDLPEQLRGLSDILSATQGRWKPSYLPEVVIAAEEDGAGDPVGLAAVALDGFPKLYTVPVRMILERSGSSGAGVVYRDQTLIDAGDAAITFLGATLVGAKDIPALRSAVDRALDGAPSNPLADLAPAGYGTAWDLYAIARNPDNVLAELIEAWGPPPDPDSGEAALPPIPIELLESAWLGVDIMPTDQIRAELVMNGIDAASAEVLLALVQMAAQEALAEMDSDAVTVTLHGECTDARATLTLDVVGISRLIEEEIRAAMDAGR